MYSSGVLDVGLPAVVIKGRVKTVCARACLAAILIISIISNLVDPGSTAPGATDFNYFNYFEYFVAP